MTHTNTNLIFVDLETTGLDSERNVILEIAALPVDKDLHLLDAGWSAVVNPANMRNGVYGLWEGDTPQSVLAQLKLGMHSVVMEMHTENGLFNEIEAGEGVSLNGAAREFIRYCSQFVPHGETPIAGSSIHFDRLFLKRYMPSVDVFFHYRIADVSCVKEFWKRWFPEAEEPPKVKAHRALDDCTESVNEALWYKSRLQLVDPGFGIYVSP